MPQSLAKVTKKINRKKGRVTGLHEHSRDAKKLRKASARDERVHRLAQTKAKHEEAYVHRIAFFKATLLDLESAHPVSAPTSESPFDISHLQTMVESYLSQSNAAHPSSKSYSASGALPFAVNRPVRPKTPAEDRAAARREAAEREYDAGFWMPDLRSEEGREKLRRWRGDWGALDLLKFARLDRKGNVTASGFPPRGSV